MKDTDELFILCINPECFATHEFTHPAEKVNMCKSLKYFIGAVNWD